MRFIILLVAFVLNLPLSALASETIPPIKASEQTFDYDAALAFSQASIGNEVTDFSLVSAKGKSVNLSDFRGKPLIISMIYTSCYQICPMTTRHLSTVVEKAREALGHDSFDIAIIGFDTQVDTPAAMQYFANKQGISDKGWHLLSVRQNDVQNLASETGFLYETSSNGFDHLIQATILDADGIVYRQVYGQAFETPKLVDPLIELVLGRPSPMDSLLTNLGSKIKLFCTTYDPVRDGYYFDYSLFIGMFIGGSIILLTGFALVRERQKG